ncbi:oxygen-dependent protoporphyrinogen oxidase [Paecilomyces lecythidis]|uniref:Protoporphyrinogen oxidase n=1 Tax=Paecilomyces lecythidis TaxID=3004212 RepID=A0ABR3XML3_9EURO
MWRLCQHRYALEPISRSLTSCCRGQRRFLSAPSKPYDAAVIGGGITGLTTAFRLSRDPNCTKVTLYEQSNQLGGWLQSETIEVDGGEVVFEYGPRTLRTVSPASLPMIDLIFELELESEIITTSKTSPAARNRYIYYPDHLVRMPARIPNAGTITNLIQNGKTLLTEPIFAGFLSSVFTEPLKEPRIDKVAGQDESVADFVSRRLSPQVAENIASALFHGIYAGDIHRLSAQALLGRLRDLEKTDRRVLGSVLNLAQNGRTVLEIDNLLALHSVEHERPIWHWKRLASVLRGVSVLTLKKGLGQLVQSLENALKQTANVEILKDTEVKGINKDQNTSDITIQIGENERTHDRVVATIGAPALARSLRSGVKGDQPVPQGSIRSLEEHNYAVSVMVVNLYYDNPRLIPYQGFGYLIPQSVPFEQNPERGLGVIFGSDSSVGQDTAPGTKLTVMMGGHWWDGWQESDFPDPETAVSMARSLLERHLHIKESPAVARARLHRNAIPQYTVGHPSRMQELSRAVRDEFDHRLTLAGSWYSGVGVTDCISQAYLSASYGVAARRLDDMNGERPWSKLGYKDWDLEGGIVSSPQTRITARHGAW